MSGSRSGWEPRGARELAEGLARDLPPGTRVEVRTWTRWALWRRRLWRAALLAGVLLALVVVENRTPRLIGLGCPGAGDQPLWANEEDALPRGCREIRRY